MFSIPHLVVIFVVALIIFGPEKLPELARNLGKVMGEFRRATGDLQSTFEGHLRDIERDAEMRRIGGTPSTGTTTSGEVALLPSSPFDGIRAVSPEGTKPSNAPNAAAIAAGNDEVDATLAAAGQAKGGEPANPVPQPSEQGEPSSVVSGSSEPEQTYDHVSDAGFRQS